MRLAPCSEILADISGGEPYPEPLELITIPHLERSFPELLRDDSPTQRVGGLVAKEFASVRHLAPMISLSSVVEEEEARDFDGRVRKLLELEDSDPPVAYECEPGFVNQGRGLQGVARPLPSHRPGCDRP